MRGLMVWSTTPHSPIPRSCPSLQSKLQKGIATLSNATRVMSDSNRHGSVWVSSDPVPCNNLNLIARGCECKYQIHVLYQSYFQVVEIHMSLHGVTVKDRHAGCNRDTRIPPQLKCTHAKAKQFSSINCKLFGSHVAKVDVVVFRHKDRRSIRPARNQAQPKCSNSLSPSSNT